MKRRLNGFFGLLLILFNAQISFGQGLTTSGTVTDERNVSPPGVNIFIEGTSEGTQTDFDGNYNLEVDQGQTLVFLLALRKKKESCIQMQF